VTYSRQADLRTVYQDKAHRCPAGYILRRREWGERTDCKDDCTACPIKQRAKKQEPPPCRQP